ncbi:MAG TPA: C25 family cysteine peptidase, partial [Vicinamibacterales bacterium]|nr:C25 family cysteine peptidase [Vicinamibacterales bacterium]
MSRTAAVCALGLVLVCACSTSAQVHVAQQGPEQIVLTCPAQAAQPAPNGQATNVAPDPLALPGAAPSWEIGKPKVPVYRVTLAVPHGADVTLSTSMTGERLVPYGREIAPYGREIAPMQPLPPTSGAGNVTRLVKDGKLYASNAPYPRQRARLVNRGFVRDVEVVTVEIAPVQYRPKTRMLVVAEGLEVTVECRGGGRLLSHRLESSQVPLYRAIVDNFPAVETEAAAIEVAVAQAKALGAPAPQASPDTGADILVITYDSFVAAITPLVTYREGQGYDVEVARINADVYTPAGATTDAQKVNALYNYIRNAYATWDPRPSFVLLVGDKLEIVPFEFTGTYGDIGYTDHYFACVSPGVPPTSGGDWFADLAIGRFSASNTTDVTNQVNKTIYYEQHPQAHIGVGGASGETGGDFENCEDCKIELLMEAGGLFCQTNY